MIPFVADHLEVGQADVLGPHDRRDLDALLRVARSVLAGHADDPEEIFTAKTYMEVVEAQADATTGISIP